MKRALSVAVLVLLLPAVSGAQMPRISEETQECFECHNIATPGIVDDWFRSMHARTTPRDGLSRARLSRRISTEAVPERLAGHVVGCAECHLANPDKHPDTFEHNGYQVHPVVTPEDCAICHQEERAQYDGNLMSHAYGNLNANPLYHDLAVQSNGVLSVGDGGKLELAPPDPATDADSCYHCHGTVVEVKGTEERDVVLGDSTFPVLANWPNQGVGRINPDRSLGSCTSCHARHQFSIEVARKPYTCSQCHKGPDVPAYAVYQVSKHGNIASSLEKEWNWDNVPWTAGGDFTAPTCATCHVSLVVDTGGEVVAQRTHAMGDRSAWRLMGLIYAAPHPKSPDTSIIRNKAGLPLPTELTGEPAADFLIDAAEQARRRANMSAVCTTCHNSGWVKEQFARYENTLRTTNAQTLAATRLLLEGWEKGVAKGPAQKDSLFNESLEKLWVEQWLFYANSSRFASAMLGADYGVFANGRWYLNKNLREMRDLIDVKTK